MAGTKLRWHVTKVMARLYRGTVVLTVIFRSTAGTAVPFFYHRTIWCHPELFGATHGLRVRRLDGWHQTLMGGGIHFLINIKRLFVDSVGLPGYPSFPSLHRSSDR
jgi:hypothetical protein